jgi:hypothetical protein
MATTSRQAVPAWYWIVAVLLTLWGAMGCYACFEQIRLGADAMGPASDYDRALHASLPGWYDYVYATAVGAGFLGGVALLVRSRTARTLFILSTIAVIVQFGYLFATTDIVATKGAGAVLQFPVFILAVALASVWFAGLARRRGWIS